VDFIPRSDMGMKRLFALVALAAAVSLWSAEADGDLLIGPRLDSTAADIPGFMALRAKLKHADFTQVQAAAQELAASRNARALRPLWELFNEGDAQRRLLAVRCVGRLGVPGEESNLLSVALREPFQAIRLSAADELARLETADKAAARLAKAAEDKDTAPLCRMRALQALSQVKGKVAAECLKAWLTSTQQEMAVAAAEGLGRLGDPAHADALVAALHTEDPEVKPAIAEALAMLTGQNHRYDLVAWSQWLKERQAAANPAADNAASAPFQEVGTRRDNDTTWDVVIVFDTTGSMLNIWPQLNAALDAVLVELIKQAPGLRMGTVRYRAAIPELSLKYLVKARSLSRGHAETIEDMKDAAFGGESGGLHLGLGYAIRNMPWRVTARKMIVLVGDTSPPASGIRACAQAIREMWQADGIQANVVYVRSSHGSEHAATYRDLAKVGPGHYYEFDKAERRLMARGDEKADAKEFEAPGAIAAKWLTIRR